MNNRFLLSIILLVFYTFVNGQVEQQNPQIDKIDILHYNFNIKLSDSTDNIEAIAKVKLFFKQKIDGFFLDLRSLRNEKGMKVSKVEISDQKVDYSHINDKLFIKKNDFGEGDTIILSINYTGIPYDGLIISKNKYNKRTFFGDNWPNRAYNWLPVVDHPSDKASVDFEVTAPSQYDVIANGELLMKKKVSLYFNYFHFSTKGIPIPTKVMVIGVADFDSKQYGEVYGIPISSLVFHPAPPNGLDDYLPAVEVMKYYIDSIGTYSYLKLANVQSKTRYGGMENAGNIFYYEASVNGRHEVESLIAHEVAHQWFGNSVTEQNWFDIWLSEGFATYLTDMYLEYKYGEDKLKERMNREREKVIRYNSQKSKPVIDTTVNDWNRLLNPNSYEKGAWFLHMLRQKVGYSNFMSILRTYYKKYKNSNATTKDFRVISEKISGQNLKSFFDQWLRSPSFPNLDIKWNIKDSMLYVETKQLQGLFNFYLQFRISNKFNKKSHEFKLKISDKQEIFVFTIDSNFNNINSTIILDPEVILLFRANVYNEEVGFNETPIILDGKLLKKGDLLFQDIDCGSLCEAIESVTFGLDSAHFSHVGIVTDIKNGEILITEAIGEKVQETKLDDFLNRSKDKSERPKVVVGRVKNLIIINNALERILKYLDKPYDEEFEINNDSYYCSELVYSTYLNKKGESIFSLNPMTYKSSRTGEYFPSWVAYFKDINVDIPEGKPGINPGGISRSDELEIIYKFGNPQGW